jgi:hypothetical protein
MTAAVVVVGILGPSAAVPARKSPLRAPHVLKHWNPGHMPGPGFGRTTLLLTTTGAKASLLLTTDRPADGERRQPNPSTWQVDPKATVGFEGRVETRKDGLTFSFETASGVGFALVCRASTAPVHAFGATVEPGRCSPCYDQGQGGCRVDDFAPVWTPARARRTRGLDCVVRATSDERGDATAAAKDVPRVVELSRVGSFPGAGHLFFAPTPGVELLIGKGDCPPAGLRETAPPRQRGRAARGGTRDR